MRTVIVKKASPLTQLYLLPPIIKLLMAFFVFVLCSAVGFYIMYQQSQNQLKTVDERKKIVQAEVIKQAQSYGELSSIAKNESLGKTRYQDLIKLLPPESSTGDLLASITKLGTESGLKFVYFRPLKAEEYGYYAAVPIDVSVIGKFHQLAKFLSGIANLPGSVVAINHFSLLHTEKNEGGLLTLEFKATLYYALPTSMDIKL